MRALHKCEKILLVKKKVNTEFWKKAFFSLNFLREFF